MRCITLFLFLGLCASALPQDIHIQIKDKGVLFMEGNDSILHYQTANIALEGKYKRSNYVHPLYSIDGHVLTEDFPEDHLHHRGIFWAWHQLYVGNKRIGDGWLIQDFKWDVRSVKEVEQKDQGKSIEANVIWKSPLWLDDKGNELPLVLEQTTVTVYRKEEKYRLIDFKISLLAKQAETKLGGSEDPKGYGGFSVRLKSVKDLVFSSSNGIVQPHLLPITTEGWIDMEAWASDSSKSGISILGHPKNPGYPNPWTLRSKHSMQNAVYPHPGAKPVPLSNEEPLVLRYRLIIHQGLHSDEISVLNAQYSKM